MIRINLLGGDRHKARNAPAFDPAQRVAAAGAVILLLTAAGLGWWWWSLGESATRVEAEIAAAQREQTRLASLLGEVAQFEQRRAQLQQRVGLIEQLRAGQSVPVQLLDHVSRSLPDMLWLTQLEQDGETLTIEGRSTTLIALSDFVGNLGGSPLLLKPIEIVNSQVESVQAGPSESVEVIRFTVRAAIAPPAGAAPAGAPPAPGPAAPAASAAAPAAERG